jgi:hypothetical protein
MGGHPYWYFVKYQEDVSQALNDLREQEFLAGRYNPAMTFIDFPLTENSPAPGPKHPSIKAALKASLDDGTRSILDIDRISTHPRSQAANPLHPDTLKALYGTTHPDHKMVEEVEFLEDVERGHCVYLVIYKDGQPDELLFAGYSFD